MCSYNLAEQGYVDKPEATFAFQTRICRKHSFQIPTQFSQWNNVFGAHAANSDGFLLSNICGSST